jgi:hypothetical protein
MATRILIADGQGNPIVALDGHHGARHAADWLFAALATLAAQGVDAIATELTPAAGGDHFRSDVLQRIGQLRVELHQRPDGSREIVGLAQAPSTPQRGRQAAHSTPVHAALRLLQAPADVIGARHAVRIPRGRHNVPPGLPRTIEEIRRARRLAQRSHR